MVEEVIDEAVNGMFVKYIGNGSANTMGELGTCMRGEELTVFNIQEENAQLIEKRRQAEERRKQRKAQVQQGLVSENDEDDMGYSDDDSE